MTRQEIILRHIDRTGRGLEIGPGHVPIAPKREGFQVQILDRCDTTTLREKLRRESLDIDKVEEVDFVWDGRSYPEIIGGSALFDWIIASHVIEHTTDLIGFLKDCDALLKPGGVLSLAIPDMRFCFDHFRPFTGLARVIDASLQPRRVHSAGAVAEYFLSVVKRGNEIAWDASSCEPFRLIHSLAEAQKAIADARKSEVYLDVHEWCFTPSSFRLLIRDLFELGFVQLRELAFHPTLRHEFYVALARHGVSPQESRLDLLRQVLHEQASTAD